VPFEMLTGKRLFAGEMVSDTPGAVLTGNDSLVREPTDR